MQLFIVCGLGQHVATDANLCLSVLVFIASVCLLIFAGHLSLLCSFVSHSSIRFVHHHPRSPSDLLDCRASVSVCGLISPLDDDDDDCLRFGPVSVVSVCFAIFRTPWSRCSTCLAGASSRRTFVLASDLWCVGSWASPFAFCIHYCGLQQCATQSLRSKLTDNPDILSSVRNFSTSTLRMNIRLIRIRGGSFTRKTG